MDSYDEGTATFQSTPSAWRETVGMINIRSEGSDISIHSLRMEGDAPKIAFTTAFVIFQSTPSAWRETVGQSCLC